MRNVPKRTMGGAYPGSKPQKQGTPTFRSVKGKANPVDRAKALRAYR